MSRKREPAQLFNALVKFDEPQNKSSEKFSPLSARNFAETATNAWRTISEKSPSYSVAQKICNNFSPAIFLHMRTAISLWTAAERKTDGEKRKREKANRIRDKMRLHGRIDGVSVALSLDCSKAINRRSFSAFTHVPADCITSRNAVRRAKWSVIVCDFHSLAPQCAAHTNLTFFYEIIKPHNLFLSPAAVCLIQLKPQRANYSFGSLCHN